MWQLLTIGAFCIGLAVCMALGWPILAALAFGLVLFLGYGLAHGHTLRSMAAPAAQSMRSAGTILSAFLLIGMLTALWRASGTIAFIVARSSALIDPVTVLPLSFILCAGMSMLIGSSFATAATMGSICMSLGISMGASPIWLGGTVLAGVYVGDRCSPVSTSALLVAQVTRTELSGNLRRMLASGAVPFAASIVVYALVALFAQHAEAGAAMDVAALFEGAFDLRWPTVLPAVLVLGLAALRLDVRIVMLVGAASAAALALGMQGMDAYGLLRCLVFGYSSADAQVAALLDGGGVVSMLNVAAIVCISSAYAGIFAETHMLDGAQGLVGRLAAMTGPFAATLVASAATCAVACNQTLAIMLTQQLCHDLRQQDTAEVPPARTTRQAGGAQAAAAREAFALDLEDSVVVVAALVPWCVACAVPLATVGAPTASIGCACFLYLLPLWHLARDALAARR